MDKILQQDEKVLATAQPILRVGRDVLRGLQTLHRFGFIHRDLASREQCNCTIAILHELSGNVLLDKQGRAVLTDFGLARKRVYRPRVEGIVPFYFEVRVLMPDCCRNFCCCCCCCCVQAPESMNPDVLRRVYSEATDSWSFGCLMWEIVTRCRELNPYEGRGELSQVMDEKVQLRPCLPRDNPLPVEVCEAINSCWAFKPAERPTAAKLLAVFERHVKPTATE